MSKKTKKEQLPKSRHQYRSTRTVKFIFRTAELIEAF